MWGESVLAMHDLALVNPPAIEVATNRRVRRTLPPWIKLVRRKDGEVAYYQGIPCQPLADAIRCRRDVRTVSACVLRACKRQNAVTLSGGQFSIADSGNK